MGPLSCSARHTPCLQQEWSRRSLHFALLTRPPSPQFLTMCAACCLAADKDKGVAPSGVVGNSFLDRLDHVGSDGGLPLKSRAVLLIVNFVLLVRACVRVCRCAGASRPPYTEFRTLCVGCRCWVWVWPHLLPTPWALALT